MDIREMLKKAIEDEKGSRDLYKRLAQEAEDPEKRVVFEELARDEENHHRRLKEMLMAIKLRKQKSQ